MMRRSLRKAGYVVKMEPSGRVMIPISIRKRLKFGASDDLEVMTYGSCVCFRKPRTVIEMLDLMDDFEDAIKQDKSVKSFRKEEICEAYDNLKKLLLKEGYKN